MKIRTFCLAFVFLLVITSWAFAGVEKVAVKGIDIQRENGEVFVRVLVEVWSQDGGEVYLQLRTDYEGKDFLTLPLRMSCAFPYQTFRFLLRRSDFRRVNLEDGLEEELPEFVAEKNIIAYVYEQKVTTPSGHTEDVKREIAQRGYALRGILAKGTKPIKWKEK